MGTHTGGSPHTYTNADAANYGVNRDHNGRLNGYAWGANVGWISLKGGAGATTYGVVTDFRHFQIYLPLVLKPS
jgi:hypothetical protein